MITAGTFFTNAVYPLSCKRHKESVRSLADFIEYSSKLLVLVVVPGLILLTVSSREIIGLIFGKEYAGAVLPFQILIWAAGIAIVCRLYHNTMTACDRQHSFMKIILASVAVNLVLNVLLIPPFGIMGAAVATVLTEFFLLVLTFVALSRVLEMRILADVATIVVCAGIASATFLFSLPLVISMLLFATVYFGLLLVMRVWGLREWRLVRMVLGRG
jgi:O-antigen/teichoic acid export membrane protein